ncbi:MAG: hypothetical protein JRJ04_00540 [Deltaproteobacteria bacterium]|nr:hypothetical protein [Deltaproteobacteria bacterium]
MQKLLIFWKGLGRRQVCGPASGLIGALVVAGFLCSSCTLKMSLQEARQVAVSINNLSYVPPPRKIDDIITVFDQVKDDPESIRKLKATAASTPSPGTSRAKLLEFYYRQGLAAQKLGYVK